MIPKRLHTYYHNYRYTAYIAIQYRSTVGLGMAEDPQEQGISPLT